MVILIKPSRFTTLQAAKRRKRAGKGKNREKPQKQHDGSESSDSASEVAEVAHPTVPEALQEEPLKVPLEDYVPITKVTKTDPIWSAYVKETQALDKEMLEAWSNNMDVLLVFAALFSAILTAFLIEVHKSLKEAPEDLANVHLTSIAQRLDYIINNETSPPTHPPENDIFAATPRSIRVNFCWFGSLTFSLLAASGAMLAKQWFREYTRGSTSGSYHDQTQLRQSRFDGLRAWRFEEVVELLPTLMHVALFLFFAGLIDFLWELHRPIALLIVSLVSSAISGVLIMNAASIYAASCPYRTPVTKHAGRLCRLIGGLTSKLFRYVYASLQIKRLMQDTKLSTLLASLATPKIQKPADDTVALMWLLEHTRNQDTTRSMLKLVPVLSTSSKRRSQLVELGVITSICNIIDSSQSDAPQSARQDADTASYLLAIHSILAKPVPASIYDGDLSNRLRILVQEEKTSKHPNTNRLILVGCLTSLVEKETKSFHSIALTASLPSTCAMAAPWARVVFLEAMSTVAEDLKERYWVLPMTVAFARSTPDRHVTPHFLRALIIAFIGICGGPITKDEYHSPEVGASSLINLFERCVKALSLKRNPADDESIFFSPVGRDAIHGSQSDAAISIVWQMAKKLVVGQKAPSLHSILSELILYGRDIDGDKISRPAFDVVLGVCELFPIDASEAIKNLPAEQRRVLLQTCIHNPNDASGKLTTKQTQASIVYAESLLGVALQIGDYSEVLPVLLERNHDLYQMIIWGCRRDRDEWDVEVVAVLRLISFVCMIKDIGPADDIHRHVDQLVEKGLLVEVLQVLPRTGDRGPVQTLLTAVNCLLALSACASVTWFDAEGSSMDDIADLARKEPRGEDRLAEGLVTGALLLFWDSARSRCEDDVRLGLLIKFIGSGILQTLGFLLKEMTAVGVLQYVDVCFQGLTNFLSGSADFLRALEGSEDKSSLVDFREFLHHMFQILDQEDGRTAYQEEVQALMTLVTARLEEVERLDPGTGISRVVRMV